MVSAPPCFCIIMRHDAEQRGKARKGRISMLHSDGARQGIVARFTAREPARLPRRSPILRLARASIRHESPRLPIGLHASYRLLKATLMSCGKSAVAAKWHKPPDGSLQEVECSQSRFLAILSHINCEASAIEAQFWLQRLEKMRSERQESR